MDNLTELDLDITDDAKETPLKQTLGFSFRSFRNLVAGCNQLGNLELESHLVKNQNAYLLVARSEDEATIGAVAIILSEFADGNYIIQDAEERMKRADILINDTAIEQLKNLI